MSRIVESNIAFCPYSHYHYNWCNLAITVPLLSFYFTGQNCVAGRLVHYAFFVCSYTTIKNLSFLSITFDAGYAPGCSLSASCFFPAYRYLCICVLNLDRPNLRWVSSSFSIMVVIIIQYFILLSLCLIYSSPNLQSQHKHAQPLLGSHDGNLRAIQINQNKVDKYRYAQQSYKFANNQMRPLKGVPGSQIPEQNSVNETKKYHNYSLSFYQKDAALNQVSNRAKLGFDNFQRHEKILKPRTIQFFLRFADKNRQGQHSLLADDSDSYMDAIFDVVKNLNSNRELMEFVLPTIDSVLTYEPAVLRETVSRIIQSKSTAILQTPKSILAVDSHQPATYEAAARIVCIVLGELPRQTFFNEQKNFMLTLLSMRKQRNKQKVSDFCLLNSLIYLNKHQVLAEVFLENGGGQLILDAFRQSGSDTQVLYYVLLNVWLLSFVEVALEKFIGVAKHGVLKSVCEVLQKLSRQKLTRVAFLIFKNVQNHQNCLQLLIDARLLKIIDTLLKGNIKNEQLIEQIRNTSSVLQSNIKVLSNFQKYARQLNNDVLEWSSVHTQRFWKQNAMKFEQNDFQLIKKLKQILQGREDKNIAIACFDLGQFCRFYPRGRNVIENLQIKELIMEKARYSQDKAVREQALLALQKLMIQNWQSI